MAAAKSICYLLPLARRPCVWAVYSGQPDVDCNPGKWRRAAKREFTPPLIQCGARIKRAEDLRDGAEDSQSVGIAATSRSRRRGRFVRRKGRKDRQEEGQKQGRHEEAVNPPHQDQGRRAEAADVGRLQRQHERRRALRLRRAGVGRGEGAAIEAEVAEEDLLYPGDQRDHHSAGQAGRSRGVEVEVSDVQLSDGEVSAARKQKSPRPVWPGAFVCMFAS